MGEVFRGVDVGWGGVERPCAIKVIASELAQRPDFVRTFIDEARLSYQLCHANIVQVRDIGQIDQTWFIAMEWVQGTDVGSLLVRLRTGPQQSMPVRFAVLVAIEAARGLDYAHRLCDGSGRPLGIVHRDISPPNLLLSYEGEVKITDFGIARWALREHVSMPGSLKGKISYMAPEQARGEDVDRRADVFALGIVLYEMLTGRNPFSLGAGDKDVLERVRAGVAPPPSSLAPSLARGLESVVMKALAPRRDDRYPTCAALREDLEAFARRESYVLSPPELGGFVRAVMEAPVDDALTRTDRQVPPRKSSRPSPSGAMKGEATPAPEIPRSQVDPTRQSGPRAALFGEALGAGLAALGDKRGQTSAAPIIDGAVVPKPTSGPMPTTRARKLAPIVKPVADETTAPIERVGDDTTAPLTRADDDDLQVPRRRIWAPIALTFVGAALGAGAIYGWLSLRTPAPPVITEPSTPDRPAPKPEPPAEPPPQPARAEMPRRSRPAERAAERSEAPVEKRPILAAPHANLSVESNNGADVFIDGVLVGQVPWHGSLTPGSHKVRVEGVSEGLRLMPKEDTVELHDGESRQLRMPIE
jgi:serine/threonine protein kinase